MATDVHAHCIPSGLIDTLKADPARYGIEVMERDGAMSLVVGGREAGPVDERLSDVAARLEAMDRSRVGRQLLSTWIDLTAYGLDPGTGARYARMFNEALAATVDRHPDRFEGLCTAPLQAPDRAAGELRHAVDRLGMVGVEIATSVEGTELDDAALDPFWAAAAEMRCLVLIHPYQPRAGRGLPRHHLRDIVANPAETPAAVGHLIFGGVLERHPDLRICLVHGGGFLPYQAGRFDAVYRAKVPEAERALSRAPSESMARMYYDTLTHSPRAVAWLVDFVGAEHVLVGSDYPFEVGDPDPVGTVEAAPGLTGEQRALILTGNAERLLAEVRRAGPPVAER